LDKSRTPSDANGSFSPIAFLGSFVLLPALAGLLGLGFSLCLARPPGFFRDFPAKAKAKNEKHAKAR
jgi:hypothetical protein